MGICYVGGERGLGFMINNTMKLHAINHIIDKYPLNKSPPNSYRLYNNRLYKRLLCVCICACNYILVNFV